MVTAPVVVSKGIHIQPSTEELKKQLIAQIDVNHDGSITREELKKFFHEKGIHAPGFRTWYALWRCDSDNSGKIDGEKELDALINFLFKHWGTSLINK